MRRESVRAPWVVRRAIVRISAAVFGSLALTLACCVCIGRVAPFSLSTRFALAHYLVIPFWIATACLGFTAKSGIRAWGAYIAFTVFFVVVALCHPGAKP